MKIICTILLAASLISLSVSIYVTSETLKEVKENSVALEKLRKEVDELDEHVITLYNIDDIASYERNRLLDGLISIFNTITETGLFDKNKPQMNMWHCNPNEHLVGEIE